MYTDRTGRCRVPKPFFQHHRISLGGIIRLHLTSMSSTVDVLCTAYPRNDDTDMVAIDASVCSGHLRSWVSGTCKVLSVYPTKVCASLRVSAFAGKSHSLYWLPVDTGFTINLKKTSIRIESTSSRVPCIVTSATTVVPSQQKSEREDQHIYSNTTVVQALFENIIRPLFSRLLLVGPPGVGKSYAARALQSLCATNCKIHIHQISIPDALATSDPISYIDSVFASCCKLSKSALPSCLTSSAPSTPVSTPTAPASPAPFSFSAMLSSPSKSPCIPSTPTRPSATKSLEVNIVMIDELDALGRSDSKSCTEAQIVVKAHICKWMDRLAINTYITPIVIIGTTNRQSDIDPCFRRGGRLEKDVDILQSSVCDRIEILTTWLRRIAKEFGFTVNESVLLTIAENIAYVTGGYVAADLTALLRESFKTSEHAAMLQSAMASLDGSVVIQHIEECKSSVPPSCLRGVSISIPKISYDDVIGYGSVKLKLQRVLSFADAKLAVQYQRFGIKSPGGVLLYGPPGNAKTRLVAAAAHSHGLPMLSLSSADVYSAYVGDAEAEIRRAFRLARQSKPCILFMDEIDALVTNRTQEGSSSNVESRVLATLLAEMDGIDGSCDGVFVVGATNRIESIDAALLRKGRFHHTLHVPCPTMEEKHQLLLYFSKKFQLPDDVCECLHFAIRSDMSGAEVENLCREAGMNIIRNIIESSVII